MRFQHLPPWAKAVQMSPVGPHGFGGQPPWPTAVRLKPSCAMAASQIAVAHGGMTRLAAVAHGGKFPHLYIRQKNSLEMS
jgi:hypothetical protein